MSSIDHLFEELLTNKWVVGATNYDEDLHFSTYYIRASCRSNTNDLYKGYNSIVAFYDNFMEKYYLLEDDCISTSQCIIESALADSTWLPSILSMIIKKTDLLGSVFYSDLDQETLSKFTDYELLNLYKSHDTRNKELYNYARLPEALDRSVNYFTNCLKSKLKEIGVNSEDIEDVFLKLTHPTKPSTLAQELVDFLGIVNGVKTDRQLTSILLANPRRARLNLPAHIICNLKTHHEKWRYMDYHGYGDRRISNVNDYVERLISILGDDRCYESIYSLEENLYEKQLQKQYLFKELGIDDFWKSLFLVFPDIGIVKLYRRYGQLRNFYYLDMLLSEIGLRLNLDEHSLRYMLPEEIIGCIEEGKSVDNKILDRKNGSCIIFHNGAEIVCSPKNYEKLKKAFEEKSKSPRNDKILKGIIACKGRIVGSCKIVIRAEKNDVDFVKGNILVSEATDPDLLKYLKIAGGVLTEQGGVTSHAAIICRELGIPTIIGVDGLLETLKNDDVVELDANIGVVRLMPRQMELPFEFLKLSDMDLYPIFIGHKAAMLLQLKKIGYRVPDFLLFPFTGVKMLLASQQKQSADIISRYVGAQLKLSENDLLAIRSSSSNEDSEISSLAGEFESILNVPLNRLFRALEEFVRLNKEGKSGKAYNGSVIIQKMVDADYAGVCLTSDKRIANNNVMIVEISKGLNVTVTGGTGQPNRLTILKNSGDILSELSRINDDIDYSFIATQAVKEFTSLSRTLSKELDIEWAYKDGKLYYLQARPIVVPDHD